MSWKITPSAATPLHRVLGLAAVLLAALTLVAGAVDAQQGAPQEKRTRQIGIMEGIIDQVLIDSPNFLVRGRDNARGIYLDEFGALFTFRAGLVPRSVRWATGLDFLKEGRFEILRKDGDVSVIYRHDAESEKEFAEQELKEAQKELEKAKKEVEKAEKQLEEERKIVEIEKATSEDEELDQQTLYQRGKDEIVQVLLDYGDTVTTLRDDQWVGIAAFLEGSDYFVDNRISRLILKARVKDLRDFAAGKISESDVRSRVVEQEY